MNRDAGPFDPVSVQKINTAVSMTKNMTERAEGLQLLDDIPMTFPLLVKTSVGAKIHRCFRSSRYFAEAQKTHTKWMQIAEKEVFGNWEQTKHLFLTKQQIAELNKAQAAYNKKNLPNAPAPVAETIPVPITPGRIREDSLTDMNSSFSREYDGSFYLKELDRYYMDTSSKASVPRTPGRHETDDSMDDLPLGSEASTSSMGSLFFSPPRRQRGRPRSRGVTSLPRRGRRGRPPLNR